MAEQNFHEASRIADRGYIIVHGEIAFEGRDLAELRESELVKSYYLGRVKEVKAVNDGERQWQHFQP